MISIDNDVITEASKEVGEITENKFPVITTKLLDKLGHCCTITELRETWDDGVILGFLMGLLAVQKQEERNNAKPIQSI